MPEKTLFIREIGALELTGTILDKLDKLGLCYFQIPCVIF